MTDKLIESLETVADNLREMDWPYRGQIVDEGVAEIKKLRDNIDFRMADRLSNAVRKVVLDTIQDEKSYEAYCPIMNVSNDGFEFKAVDESPDGFVWFVSVRRFDKIDTETL